MLGRGPVDYARVESDPGIRRRLMAEYGLEPGTMKAVDALYGPLDWTMPEVHAVYWAYRAKQRAPGEVFLPAERMVYQSLGTMFRHGKIGFDAGGCLKLRPNTAMLDSAMKAYEASLKATGEETIRMSYIGFLKEAVGVLHAEGDDAGARRIHGMLMARFPKDVSETWEQLVSPDRLKHPRPAAPMDVHNHDHSSN
jgi:hypothetical protein